MQIYYTILQYILQLEQFCGPQISPFPGQFYYVSVRRTTSVLKLTRRLGEEKWERAPL